MNAAHRYIKQRLEVAKQHKFTPSPVHVFLDQHGVEFNTIAATRGHKRRASECYANSANLMLTRSDLRYVEGIAIGKDGFGIEHAWVIDAAGEVIDVTLDEPANYSYFGVAMDSTFVSKWLVRSGDFGSILGRIEPMRELEKQT
jgi:hypothetical protein